MTRWSFLLRLLLPAILVCNSLVFADSFDNARRWTDAKLLGVADPRPTPATMLVQLKSGTLARNRIKDRSFRIAARAFDKGIAMPSPGEIVVRLPAPASHFDAVVGVDSNDLGYYANQGRGGVEASIHANGRELFRSPYLKEGIVDSLMICHGWYACFESPPGWVGFARPTC